MRRAVIVVCWGAVLAGTALGSAAVQAASEGQNLFEKRCAACHKLPDPATPPTIGWEKQLDVMAPLARLKAGQKQSVLEFLVSHTRDAAMAASRDEDRSLFEEKCSLCHSVDRVLLSPLRGNSLRHVIDRMQSRSGVDWLSDADVEKVLAYLDSAPAQDSQVDPLGSESSAEQVFQTRCSACHTLERVFLKIQEAGGSQSLWSHTVSRMREKAPQWMTDQEATRILEYLQSLRQVTE